MTDLNAPECDTCGLPDPANNPYCFCKQEQAMTNANALPIQERLREQQWDKGHYYPFDHWFLEGAADRIDALEKALREAEADAEKWRNQEKMLAVYLKAHCDASPPEGR